MNFQSFFKIIEEEEHNPVSFKKKGIITYKYLVNFFYKKLLISKINVYSLNATYFLVLLICICIFDYFFYI